MELSALKDIFFILGVLLSIAFVLEIVVIAVIKLHDFIAEYRYAKRYEYMINHRFDDPPLANQLKMEQRSSYPRQQFLLQSRTKEKKK